MLDGTEWALNCHPDTAGHEAVNDKMIGWAVEKKGIKQSNRRNQTPNVTYQITLMGHEGSREVSNTPHSQITRKSLSELYADAIIEWKGTCSNHSFIMSS